MKRLDKEGRAGLYLTVIVHLSVIIVLLVAQLGFSVKKETSFVLDFSKQEQIQKREQEELFKDDISKKIDQLLASSGVGSMPVRNIAVDRSSLKDSKGTDAEQLYKDAERLQRDLDNGKELPKEDDSYVEYKPEKTEQKWQTEETYSGPSVVSYSLDGRKASRLPIPAYRCMGAGLVTVIIVVDNAGNVVNAKVEDAVSSQDQCLRNFAVRAARLSRFSSSPSAPARQAGNIVYQFIAQ